jgi:2-oxoisovalerate dehydrogenase E2 component (dihydrolipoyl transacylase)
MIAVGAPLIVFETAADAATGDEGRPVPKAAPSGENAAAANDAPGADDMAESGSRVMASPAIRRRAREAGIKLGNVPGTGTGGRILRADFERFLKREHGGAAATERPVTAAASEVKVIGLRRVIAERMSAAKREIPHFSYVEELDITELEGLRQHLNRKRMESDQRLTLLPLIGLALVRALQHYPQCNSTYDKERNTLLRHKAVHLGIATQTPDGLKVPVVRNCEHRALDDLSAEIRRVSDAARNNSIKREELSGSTITLTSLGKLGGIVTTPVINMPEVAIIGVNRAVLRPVVQNGQVAVRLMMNLSSSFDHRFVDGYDAAEMIQFIKDLLEHPATIFLQGSA